MRYLALVGLFISFLSFSQTKVFLGEFSNPNDLVYTFNDKGVKRMTSTFWGNQILFLRDNKVYSDNFYNNCLYTIVGTKIYRGDSQSVFDVLYEVDQNKLYQISSSSLKKCLYTLYNNKIYVGDSKSTFDCVFSVEFDPLVNNNELLLFLCLAPY